MLINVHIKTTTKWCTLFGFEKSETTECDIVYSVENEDVFRQYMETRMKLEETRTKIGLFRGIPCKVSNEYHWVQMQGNDDDAHVLILQSPTGVIYDHQHRYV